MKYPQLVATMAFLVLASAAVAGEFATRDEAVEMVHRATARVAEVGMDTAKPEFMDHGGKFFDRDLYMVILDKAGVRLVHGLNSKLVGKPYSDAIDVNGKAYGKEGMEVAAGPGKGWISYSFKDPITGKVLPKQSYIEKTGEFIYIAGIYTR